MMKKLLIILFVFLGCTLSSAYAYPFDSQTATAPAYTFKSTSTCVSVVGQSSYASPKVYAPYSGAPSNKPRRTESNPWNEEGDPSGQQVGQVDTPIGEPWILLLLAMVYILGRVITPYIWKTGKN
ncbi:MAG: hypothetical protein II644_02075 [Paludibacteraceae bacterium]|nr:hypothetical protein [Paludibacteraceae bacterium]